MRKWVSQVAVMSFPSREKSQCKHPEEKARRERDGRCSQRCKVKVEDWNRTSRVFGASRKILAFTFNEMEND